MNVLVTGVSRGVGLTITKVLLEQNYCVYGISRTLTQDLEILKNNYTDTLFLKQIDLQQTDQIKQNVFQSFVTNSIPLHGYINNAAVAYDDIITNMNLESLIKMFNTNVFSPFMATKYAIRNMLFNNISGSIVHISSISVHTGYKGLSMYAGSKGSIEAFSKNTAREWGVKGIRSNVVVPGFMETNMSSSLSFEQKQKIYSRTSLKKGTDLSSVAETVAFLLSEKSKSITGQNIHVDGGTI